MSMWLKMDGTPLYKEAEPYDPETAEHKKKTKKQVPKTPPKQGDAAASTTDVAMPSEPAPEPASSVAPPKPAPKPETIVEVDFPDTQPLDEDDIVMAEPPTKCAKKD